MSHRVVVSAAALTLALAASALSTDARAQALLGGTVSLTMVPGLGACNASAQVSTSTPQDTFTLGVVTPAMPGCGGQSASGSMHAEASTRSIGMKLTASGPQTTAAGLVSFIDTWIITPPPGTPTGLVSLPVSFALEGLVAPGSTFAFGRFLDYSFSISDVNGGGGNPLPNFQVTGQISATGVSTLAFNGTVNFSNLNQASQPMKALVEMMLFAPQLNAGSIDFYNTAVASIALPPGFSATTSSGIPLVFAPVPEPQVVALWALGLAALGLVSRRRVV
jgi:hypothetical protein